MYNRCTTGFHSMMSYGIWMWIIGIIILVAIIWMFTRYSKNQSNTSNNTALKILEERYARGEIDEIEYSSKKSILSNS